MRVKRQLLHTDSRILNTGKGERYVEDVFANYHWSGGSFSGKSYRSDVGSSIKKRADGCLLGLHLGRRRREGHHAYGPMWE